MKLAQLRQIHVGSRFVVFRAQRDGAKVVVKTVRPDRHDAKNEARLRQEYALLSDLAVPGVVRPLSMEELEGRPALVLVDVGPTDLEEWLPGARLSVPAFLELATQLVSIVARLHRRSIVHRDLCPANFVLGDSGRLTLVDFELGARVGVDHGPGVPGRLEATLQYLAPEQTGRMKRLVDQRADL
jgi:serine/threonine protein kinase